MRRILGFLLLLVLALPLVAPALGQPAQKKLLLCCLKGGAHHCMTAAPTDATPTLRAQCPACPNQAVAGHADTCIAVQPTQRAASEAVAPLAIRQVEAGYRISFHRSRHKRGSPAVVLS